MSSPINDGGPAFPGFLYTSGHGPCKRNADGDWETYSPGLSLRAYLAGKALSGLVIVAATGEVDDFGPQNVAREALSYADALIAELEKS